MENYSDDYFKDSIEWELFLPMSEKMLFRFSILPNNNPEDLGSSDFESGEELLGILQDTFYVTHLANIHYDKESENYKGELDRRDNYWNLFRWVWHKFTDFLRNNFNEIRISQDAGEILPKRSGQSYKQYVKEMGAPFESRYNLYIFSLLFWPSTHIQKTFGSRTDIICKYQVFTRFWNGILTYLSDSVRILQKIKVKNLKSRFKKILNYHQSKAEYKTFKEEFLGKKGCFSLTKVEKKDGSRQDVLCFSGLNDYAENSNIGKAIKKIEKDGGFQNPIVVQVTGKIRYDLICGLSISYGKAQKCSVFSKNGRYNRMFSCCERKTIAGYTWIDCASYRMIVKYAPCELCNEPVRKHNALYNGKVIPGKATKPLERIGEYKRLAKCICSSFYPIRRFHFPHLCKYCGTGSK